MPITFYYAPMSSAGPVACALAELELVHQRVVFDITKQDHKQPSYLAINPNGVVPAIDVDGTPGFEALAIQLWLADTYGVDKGLWPAATDPRRIEALSWCTWSYVTYGTMLVRLQMSSSPRVDASLHNEAHARLALGELSRLLGLLEERLGKASYLLGEEFSLADLCVGSVVGYSLYVGASLEGRPRTKAWLEAFQARPSFTSVTAGDAELVRSKSA